MSKDPNHVSFTVTVTGENSKKQFAGKFTVKKRLSFRDQLALDSRRRELIGNAPGTPLPRAESAANIFSELHTRIVEAPSWWTDNDNGLDLIDDAVVAAVYDEAAKVVKGDAEKAEAEADKAQADLKAAA